MSRKKRPDMVAVAISGVLIGAIASASLLRNVAEQVKACVSERLYQGTVEIGLPATPGKLHTRAISALSTTEWDDWSSIAVSRLFEFDSRKIVIERDESVFDVFSSDVRVWDANKTHGDIGVFSFDEDAHPSQFVEIDGLRVRLIPDASRPRCGKDREIPAHEENA